MKSRSIAVDYTTSGTHCTKFRGINWFLLTYSVTKRLVLKLWVFYTWLFKAFKLGHICKTYSQNIGICFDVWYHLTLSHIGSAGPSKALGGVTLTHTFLSASELLKFHSSYCLRGPSVTIQKKTFLRYLGFVINIFADQSPFFKILRIFLWILNCHSSVNSWKIKVCFLM